MRWLQWSPNDLTTGLGGVEVHARSLARELRALGVDAQFSKDPRDLERVEWDVIHLHGSGYRRFTNRRAIRVHTLHGSTLGRMRACGEWLWPGGYLAWLREVRGVRRADIVLTVREDLGLYDLAKRLGKTTDVYLNGWDSGVEKTPLPPSVQSEIDGTRPRWLFVGRGDDRMKGADRIKKALDAGSGIRLFAAPGTGFEGRSDVVRTGTLDSSQVLELMDTADALLIPSRYEGHSLVVLEALASGLVVVATPVGGVPFLGPVKGLEITPTGNPDEILAAIERVRSSDLLTEERRLERAIANRALLPRWKDIAKIALGAVERLQASQESSAQESSES